MSVRIPEGKELKAKLKRLDRQSKKELMQLAQRGQAHPDPEMAALVAGFARWAGRGLSPRYYWWLIPIYALYLLVWAFWPQVFPGGPLDVAIGAGLLLLLLLLCVPWRRRLERAERLNREVVERAD